VEIRDLEYFLACCQAGSFTAAAREVHIVQSAMSSAVARLEHELGAPLFDRSVTPVTVTEQGAALQAAAQRVLDAVPAARDEVAAVSGHVRGTVALGCTLSTGPLDLGAVLADLRDRHPGIVIQLRQSLTGSTGNLRAVRPITRSVAAPP
jgi:DNA-binding transcriptional LysR family regulator